MPALTEASLTAGERRVIDRLLPMLAEGLPGLVAVWLYGSRARGDPPHRDSDVDLMVIAQSDNSGVRDIVNQLSWDAAVAENQSPFAFSLTTYSTERLAQRREIRSFFIQEVDRDKIVLCGRR